MEYHAQKPVYFWTFLFEERLWLYNRRIQQTEKEKLVNAVIRIQKGWADWKQKCD